MPPGLPKKQPQQTTDSETLTDILKDILLSE